jgi:adenylate kinase family enzyme
LLHLPLFHLDKYFFVSGWQERNYEEFLDIQKDLVEQEYWVIDGNATRSLEMRFSRADTVLYFRFNRLLCLWRIFKRLINKNPHISDRAEGCTENVRLRLIRYLWEFSKRVEGAIVHWGQALGYWVIGLWGL